MFCPRCGVQIVETTKYCKSCGFALAHVMDFVASGGTTPLTRRSLAEVLTDLPPGHKMVLIIMTLIFSPILLGALPFLVPIAIVWMILNHQKQKRYGAFATPPPPTYLQPPQAQPMVTNQFHQPQPAQVPVQQTGPLASPAPPNSVVEEETRQLLNH